MAGNGSPKEPPKDLPFNHSGDGPGNWHINYEYDAALRIVAVDWIARHKRQNVDRFIAYSIKDNPKGEKTRELSWTVRDIGRPVLTEKDAPDLSMHVVVVFG